MGTMGSVVRSRPLDARSGITVDTATRARFVHAKVFALDTVAWLSLAAVFPEPETQPEGLLDQPIIDALPRSYAGQLEFVGTALDCDLILSGCFGKRTHQPG